MLLDPGGHFRDVGHEGGVAEQEVVGREDRHRRFGIAPGDPVRRVEHPGGGAAIERLGQDPRARGAGELLGDVAGVPADRDDERTLRRDGEGHAVEGLAQERARAEEAHVLLRPIGAEHLADQRPQSHALAAGQDHRPAVRRFDARATVSVLQ